MNFFSKKWFFTFLKLIIVLFSFFYIYKRFQGIDFGNIEQMQVGSFFLLLSAFALAFVNWAIESYKWQYLNFKNRKISFWLSFRSVLIGLAIGLLTPNRVGEPLARGLVFDRQYQKISIINATLSSFAQMLATLIFGIAGIMFFFINKLSIYSSNILYLVFLIFTLFFILIVYFNFSKLLKSRLFRKIFNKPLVSDIDFAKNKELSNVLIISLIRYMVFVFQNFLLLLFFNVEIYFFDAFFSIAAMYIVINVLPGFFIADLGVRGSAAIFFISQFSNNIKGIIFAIFVLWFINILLPALLGQLFLIRCKLDFSNKK